MSLTPDQNLAVIEAMVADEQFADWLLCTPEELAAIPSQATPTDALLALEVALNTTAPRCEHSTGPHTRDGGL